MPPEDICQGGQRAEPTQGSHDVQRQQGGEQVTVELFAADGDKREMHGGVGQQPPGEVMMAHLRIGRGARAGAHGSVEHRGDDPEQGQGRGAVQQRHGVKGRAGVIGQ